MSRNSLSSQAVSAAPESVWGGASGKMANAAGGLFRAPKAGFARALDSVTAHLWS